MEIEVHSRPDYLEFTMGPVQAQIAHAQGPSLRDNLDSALRNALKDPLSRKEGQLEHLQQLIFLLELMLWLDDEQARQVVIQMEYPQLVPLWRFARQYQPAFIDRLSTLMSQRAAEQLEDSATQSAPIPADRVIEAFEALHPMLAECLGNIMPPLPPMNYDPAIGEQQFAEQAVWLKSLPEIPPERRQQIFQLLEPRQRLQLWQLARAQRWSGYDEWLAEQLKPAEYEQLAQQLDRIPPQPQWVRDQLCELVSSWLAPARHQQRAQNESVSPSKTLLDKSSQFLDQLGHLQAAALQQLLKQLSRQQLLHLIGATGQTQSRVMQQKLATILPSKLYTQLRQQAPKKLNDVQLRHLLTELNQLIRTQRSPGGPA